MRKYGAGFAAVTALSLVVAGRVDTLRAQESADASRRAVHLMSSYQLLPNIVYRVASGVEQKLDVYQPNGLQSPNRTVMFFHGGGWTTSSKEASTLSLLPWIDMGFTVVNVEYRLTNVALAPAAAEDARCALRWVYRNQKQYNFDVKKIVTTGQSAGGHLSLTTGMLPASAGMDNTCPGDRTGNASNPGPTNTDELKVAAIVDQYGISDVNELLGGANARTFAIAWLGSMLNREEIARQVSPIRYVKAGIPPVFSVHGDQDPTVPYSQKQTFHQALEKAGLPHELFTVPGGKHGGFTEEENVKIYAAVRAFLTKHGILAAAVKTTAAR
jgi:acetyl esterase/lipase